MRFLLAVLPVLLLVSCSFRVPDLSLSGITPDRGAPGTQVTITGNGLARILTASGDRVLVCGVPLENYEISGEVELAVGPGAVSRILVGTEITGTLGANNHAGWSDVSVAYDTDRRMAMTSAFFCSLPAAPVAVNDSYEVEYGQTLNVPAPGVLANDSGDPVPVVVAETVSSFEGGSVVLNRDGSLVYTPPAEYSGADSAAYTITNEYGEAPGRIDFLVADAPLEPQPGPVAVNDAYAVPFGTTLTVGAAAGVLLNDEGDPRPEAVASVSPTGRNGQFSLSADGGFTYVPAVSFTGIDTADYVIASAGRTATAVVTFTVGVPPAVAGLQDVAIRGNIGRQLDIDTSAGGNVTFPTAPYHGIALWDPLVRTVSYYPAPGYTGRDSFEYELENAFGSNSAIVTLDISEPVWFIDPQAVPGGDGSPQAPLNGFAAFQHLLPSPVPDGHTIYLLDDSLMDYADFNLWPGWWLLGGDAAPSGGLAEFMGERGRPIPDGSIGLPQAFSGDRTGLWFGRESLQLMGDNLVAGVTLVSSGLDAFGRGPLIEGSDFGTAEFRRTNVNADGRPGLWLEDGELAPGSEFDELVSLGAGRTSLHLDGVGGLLAIGRLEVRSGTADECVLLRHAGLAPAGLAVTILGFEIEDCLESGIKVEATAGGNVSLSLASGKITGMPVGVDILAETSGLRLWVTDVNISLVAAATGPAAGVRMISRLEADILVHVNNLKFGIGGGAGFRGVEARVEGTAKLESTLTGLEYADGTVLTSDTRGFEAVLTGPLVKDPLGTPELCFDLPGRSWLGDYLPRPDNVGVADYRFEFNGSATFRYFKELWDSGQPDGSDPGSMRVVDDVDGWGEPIEVDSCNRP